MLTEDIVSNEGGNELVVSYEPQTSFVGVLIALTVLCQPMCPHNTAPMRLPPSTKTPMSNSRPAVLQRLPSTTLYRM